MVGLGGLEPPTSPLSGARSSHLSYRPSQTEEEKSYNLFSLRCLSVIRNCVQTCGLCTEQQFLYHWSLLSVLKMRVVARDSQAGMSNLIFHEVAEHHAGLHVADSTMPEGVHPTGFDSDFLAEWCKNPSANIPVLKWSADPWLKEPAGLTRQQGSHEAVES
jgi:hypothetical protein